MHTQQEPLDKLQ